MIEKENDQNKISTTIPQVEEGGDRNVNQTTEFLDDAAVVTAQIPQAPLDYNYLKNSMLSGSGEVKAFLAKPQKLAAGTLTTADTATSFSWLQMPHSALTPLRLAKLDGYFGFRADLHFRIQFNATKFQQGRYMLCYVPTGGAGDSPGFIAWREAHASTRVQRTQLPHVEFDLNLDTKADLVIPYSNAYDFYPLRANTNLSDHADWGYLRIFPYVPLVAASGDNSASYTLWAWFENVDLIGPAQPQSSGIKMASEMEQAKAGVGPIQSTAEKVSKAMGYLNPVPILSSFSKPVQWASDIVANVASVFGWSAPANLEHAYRVVRAPALYGTNVNKVDNSLPISTCADNHVSVHPSFAYDTLDELDFVKFVMRPSFLREDNWAATTAVGGTLLTIGIQPHNLTTTRTVGGIPAKDYIPCDFVASRFNYWRGSMVYTFKFVKTEYHSGRVAIVFFPEDRQSGTIPGRTYDSSDYVLRDIVDIREHNEITLTVPYLATTPYRPVQDGAQNWTKTGTLVMYVADELVAPDSVSQSITILTEVSMGPDAEFFSPNMKRETMNLRAVVQSAGISMMDKSDHSFKQGVIGGAEHKDFQVDTAAICVGERITNFRLLLRRFMGMFPSSENGNATSPNLYNIYKPFSIAASSTSVDDTAGFNGDLFDQLGSIFCYSRGGVRVKLKDITAANQTRACLLIDKKSRTTPVDAQFFTAASDDGVVYTEVDPGQFNYVFQDGREEKFLEVQVPMYSMFHSRPNAANLSGTGEAFNYDVNARNRNELVVYEYDPSGTRESFAAKLLRSGADDCNFGGFISIPPFSFY